MMDFRFNVPGPALRRRSERFAIRVGVGAMGLLASMLASAGVEWPPPAAVEQRWFEAVEMMDRIQAMLPPAIEGVESLADRLDYDIEAAIAHVRDEVRYEPYLGVLRGPDGAAVAAAGNAWDQALLLAALVKAMGADAQVVAGTIAEDDARRLLMQVFDPPAGAVETLDRRAMTEAVSAFDPQLAKSLGQRMDEWASGSSSSSLDAETVEISKTLQALLQRAKVRPPVRDGTKGLVTALSTDYAWVRWRDGPGSEWRDLHPAFAGEVAPKTNPKRYFGDAVPPEFQHRVAFRLWIERVSAADSEPQRVPIMDAFERPTAQLFKQPLVLGMAPLSEGKNGPGALLVPMLDDGLAPGAQAVSELGLTASADVTGGGFAALFATLSARMGDGLGALSQIGGGKSSKPKLTAVVLTIEQSAPWAEPVILERRLIDLRQTATAAFPDSAVFELLFKTDVGAPNGAQATRRFLTQQRALFQALPYFYAFARGALSDEEFRATPQIQALDRSAWLDWDLLSPVFLSEPAAREAAFRPGPMLASRRRISNAETGALTITDINSNPVTVLHLDDSGDIRIETGSAMKQGVRDTLVESFLLPPARGWSERRPKRLVVDAAGLDQDVTASAWPPAARQMAIKDLSSGFVLAVVDQKEPHWWRVHRVSGETLGMGQYGGQEIAEFIVTAGSIGLSTYLFKNSVESCDQKYANNRKMADCCIVGNLITTYGSSVVGAAVGATAGSALAEAMEEGFIEAPFAAAVGYVTTMLNFDVPFQIFVDAAVQGPIGSVCAARFGK